MVLFYIEKNINFLNYFLVYLKKLTYKAKVTFA